MSRLLRRRPYGWLVAGVTGWMYFVATGTVLAQAKLTRGPYLQLTAPTSVLVRWRTDLPEISEVRFGTNASSLTQVATALFSTNWHSVALSNLQPHTLYYYSVGTPGTVRTNGLDISFQTAPVNGSRDPMRIWVLGDSGMANMYAGSVRDAYYALSGNRRTDVWLMLGDNAYTGGSDALYQTAVFNTYPTLLRQTTLWSTIGNQETAGSSVPSDSIAYFEVFNFPRQAELGGEPSGSERYYSFNYGNVHFVCLDSMTTARTPGSPMLTWLEADLARNVSDWTVAFWHHPPYSKGNRDSDLNVEQIEMRTNAVPILEAYGVDLVFTGHCHSYERSYLIDGHYGMSTTFSTNFLKDGGDGRIGGSGAYHKATLGPGSHEGTVYVVAGSGSSVNSGPFNHPVMYLSKAVPGSVVLDVHANRLEARFLRETGAIDDRFTIVKGPTQPIVRIAPASGGAVDLDWNAVADRTYRVETAPTLPADLWSDWSGPVRADGIRARWTSPPANSSNAVLRIRSAED